MSKIFVILCRALRVSTNSWITIVVPEENNDPEKATAWVCKEFNYQFIPMRYDLVTPEVAQQELTI